jgi:hypothetical protein
MFEYQCLYFAFIHYFFLPKISHIKTYSFSVGYCEMFDYVSFSTLFLMTKVETSFQLLDISLRYLRSLFLSSLSDEAVIPTPFWH